MSTFEYGLFLVDVNVTSLRAQLPRKSGRHGEQHRYRETLSGTEWSECPHVVERRECEL